MMKKEISVTEAVTGIAGPAKELTREAAIALSASGWWTSKTDREIAEFQLFTERLCMPFGRFQEALEKCLKRSVFTHELAYPNRLKEELMGKRPAPTFEDLLELIPAEKRLLVKL